MRKSLILLSACLLLASCGGKRQPAPIQTLAWVGIAPSNAEVLFPMAKECGFDLYYSITQDSRTALHVLDAAAKSDIGVIVHTRSFRDSVEATVSALKGHPALVAWGLKDEPETWDIPWLADLVDKVAELDPEHPSYINLYPDWAWGGDKYAEHIEMFANGVENVDFYSFDQYPVTQAEDGSIHVRDTWYRNLEVFSDMARRHGKPFWAFALAKSHHLGPPSPPAFYPEPTMGHLRLQVYSDLLYGAQLIQYFTFAGAYDSQLEKTPVFDFLKQMNGEIKAWSRVFSGCSVKGVWHCGKDIPYATRPLEEMPHKKLKSLSMDGAVVSLLESPMGTCLAVQNSDCVNPATLSIEFAGNVKRLSINGEDRSFRSGEIEIEPGNIEIFKL